MKKRFIFVLIIYCYSITSSAQYDRPPITNVVEAFGRELSSWADGSNSTLKQEQFTNIISFKNPKFKISGNLADTLAKRHNYLHKTSYELESFINWVQREKDIYHNLKIKLSKIKEVPYNKIINPKNGYSYVKCVVEISSSSFYFKSNCLFAITNHRIAKIGSYEEQKDKEGNIWVFSLDRIQDSQGFGIAYEYGKGYPVNVSILYSKSLFMIGLDFGMADNNNLISTQKVDFTDLLNYKITQGEYKPQCYLTLTPAIYMKYISVGWGIGVLLLEGKTNIKGQATEVYGDVVSSSDLDASSSESSRKARFFMRPNLKLYIPCGKHFSIFTSASYNWAWGSKDLCGFTYGLGLRYNID